MDELSLMDKVKELEDKLLKARRDEREKIMKLLPEIPTRFSHNKTCFDCIARIKRQILKRGEVMSNLTEKQNELLLTDKDYKRLVKYIPIPEHDLRKIAQAQLAKAEPIIRKDERERMVAEINKIIREGQVQEQKDWVKTWWLVKNNLMCLSRALKEGKL